MRARGAEAQRARAQARKLEGWSLYNRLPEARPARAKALQDVWELFLDGTLKPYTGALPARMPFRSRSLHAPGVLAAVQCASRRALVV